MNNDFWSRVRWFANDFHSWLHHSWKSLGSRVRWFANDFHSWLRHSWKSWANHLTRDRKSLFTVTHALFFISFEIRGRLTLCEKVMKMYSYYPEHNLARKGSNNNTASICIYNVTSISTANCAIVSSNTKPRVWIFSLTPNRMNWLAFYKAGRWGRKRGSHKKQPNWIPRQ